MRIRDWHPSDFLDLCRVCLETGDSGKDATGLYQDSALMGLFWAVPYAIRDGRLALVVELEAADLRTADQRPSGQNPAALGPDGAAIPASGGTRVAGYILGSDDVVAYRRWLAAEWLPALRRRYPVIPRLSSAESWLRGEIAKDPELENEWPDYPGELHIDLLPCLQGKGLGRTLMDAFSARLASVGCPGFHLGVAHTNKGAVGFYRKYGLVELGGDDETLWFGKRLV